MKRPTSGKIKASTGKPKIMAASSLTSRSSASGRTKATMSIAPIIAPEMTSVQWKRSLNWPPRILPKPRVMARMLAIRILLLSLNANTFSLNVGNQVIIPCSTITYRKAEKTNTTTNSLVIRPSMAENSSLRGVLFSSLGSSGMRARKATATNTKPVSRRYTLSQALGSVSLLKAGKRK